MKHIVKLKNGAEVPALGLGTWYLGDDTGRRAREIAALRTGIEKGMTLIDTAEMYGGGRSERLVGEAIKGTERGRLFIVSKVLPNNAGRRGIFRSCEESLQRLGTDYLDLYLLHWRGSVPLAETVECMEKLERDGMIRGWGVSNFDTDDMEELRRVKGGDGCLVNQVLYHAASRGIEYSLLPQMRERGVALMAYCPLAQGGSLRRGLFRSRALNDIAARRGATVAQILLAWTIRGGNVIAIPRSSSPEHTAENAGADAIELTAEELAAIDREFAPPRRKEPLDIQ